MMRLLPTRPTVAAMALLVGVAAFAQTPTPKAATPGEDTLFMSTSVGSFKILPPGPDTTRGVLDIDFEGTLMVSGLKGTATPSGGVQLEYERPKHNRRVYFGKGHIRVAGDFRSIQFFGRNLKGSFHGTAVARLYGEFDRQMETGYYWYASNPEKVDWGTYGRTVVVPPQAMPGASKPTGKVRVLPKNGG